MKLKALVVAGLALLGVVSLSQGAFAAGGTCPTGSARDTYQASLAECSLPKEEDIKKNNGDKDLMTVVVDGINVVVGIVGVIAVVVLVIGGIFYVTSTGDPAKAKRAITTIIYGVVGLVIATIAFAIVNFILVAVFSSGGSKKDDGDKDKKEGDENGALVIDYSDIA